MVRGHAFRNALIPIVTVVGLELGGLLGGAVVTETVFAWPGVGKLTVGRDLGARLPGDAGGGPAARGGLRRDQPAGRPLLRRDRPPHPVQLMSTSIAVTCRGLRVQTRRSCPHNRSLGRASAHLLIVRMRRGRAPARPYESLPTIQSAIASTTKGFAVATPTPRISPLPPFPPGGRG